MTEPMPAQNVVAEQTVLGSCMLIEDHRAYPALAGIIDVDDFYRPAHAEIWDVIGELHRQGTPSDPVLVLEELTRRGAATRVGGATYIHTLYAAAAPSYEHHAQLVADCAVRRRVEVAGKRLVQWATGGNYASADLIGRARDEVAAVQNERAGVDVLTDSYDAFMAAQPENRPMVIPGLLGLGDRMILTGQGGVGKSTLSLMLAVCAASGMHPFDYAHEDPYEPQRVGIFDCENADHRLKTRLWPIVRECERAGGDPRPNLTIGGHGNSFNLLNPQNALSLLRTVEHDKLTLLYIGPLYKMHSGDPDKESDMKKVADVLDSVRALGVSIITEAHHSKEGKRGGTLEPSGSNLWTWWPEFGLGLRLADGDNVTRRCYLERWRIDRDASQWPSEVEASGQVGLAWARADSAGWHRRSA